MAKAVRLHGGPYHGQVTSVVDGTDHFHIIRIKDQPRFLTKEEAAIADATEVATQTGTYSKAHGSPVDFEWDGWIAHE